MRIAHAWAHESELAPPAVQAGDFPWLFEQLRREEVVAFSRPDDLPAEAARDADSYRRRGVRSSLIIPLEAAGHVLGGLSLSTLRAERTWSEVLLTQVKLIAEVFASAVARREAEDALRGSEMMKSAILASLPSSVAVLDREGRIIAVNESWTRFVNVMGGWRPSVGVGSNYLDIWHDAEQQGLSHATDARVGVEQVLDRTRTGFGLEYGGAGPIADRWFGMSVVPLNRPEGGAVVSHTDVTERKRAELSAQRSQQELAHFTRVSTVGELTASLAHELNQPLTGILTNAQAARRFLEVTPPDLGELRSIVADIIADDKRAGEVIQRLRDLLAKREAERVPMDLNALIRDMAKLLSSDALIRKVTVTLDLDPGLPPVVGDRVQLQQIILNLMLNAMESMTEGARADHTLVVRTDRPTPRWLRVVVEDTGTGLRDGTAELVFEPFYTTKSTGIGMGLAIVRSIVDAHGGAIWAENNAKGGASFNISLPLLSELS
jgi:C4-dicarboxylate-specific signal transduction histidine kinase